MSDAHLGILSHVSLFAGLKENHEALKTLMDLMIIKDYPQGHVLIKEGTMGDEFYIVIHGQVSVFKNTPDGDMYKVVILKGDIHPALGEGGLIDNEPRSATVICDIQTQCFVLTKEKFTDFCDAHPKWAVSILNRIALALMERVRKSNNDMMLLHKALMNEIRGV